MGEKNINKKPITVYWSPYTSKDYDGEDWSFLYPKPKFLFSDLLQNKSEQADNKTYLSCPAVANKFKKMLTFYSPMSCSYKYDFLSNPKTLENLTDNYIFVNPPRQPAISNGPSLEFSLKYIMFADSPVNVYFTPPMFHEPKYMKFGSVIPGEFDIGKWFRPYNFEVQVWDQSGEIHIEENEPLFYAEIKTDRPIVLKQFELSNRLVGYARANVGTTELFGRGQTLLSRYNRFNSIGMREKILTEIKKNLID